MNWLQSFFNTPSRQAVGWTALGVLGIAMAAGGVWFLTEDGGGGRVADADDSPQVATATATATRTSTATASPTASPSPSPTATETPVPTATQRPAVNTGASTGGADSAAAADPTATPEPTEPPVVSSGEYCPPSNSGGIPSPPNSVLGQLTIGGELAPPGTEVTLAFDGAPGPSRATSVAGGYRVDYAGGKAGCANQFGSAISVIVGGEAHATGHTVGDSPGLPVRLDIAVP